MTDELEAEELNELDDLEDDGVSPHWNDEPLGEVTIFTPDMGTCGGPAELFQSMLEGIQFVRAQGPCCVCGHLACPDCKRWCDDLDCRCSDEARCVYLDPEELSKARAYLSENKIDYVLERVPDPGNGMTYGAGRDESSLMLGYSNEQAIVNFYQFLTED